MKKIFIISINNIIKNEYSTYYQRKKFINNIINEHSWYKHLYRPYKFYILFNIYEKNCKKYGGLYYFTDYFDPPYDCRDYESLYLPDKRGKLTIEIPEYIWESCYLYFDKNNNYDELAYEKIEEMIDRLINLTYNTINYDGKIVKKTCIEKEYEKIMKKNETRYRSNSIF